MIDRIEHHPTPWWDHVKPLPPLEQSLTEYALERIERQRQGLSRIDWTAPPSVPGRIVRYNWLMWYWVGPMAWDGGKMRYWAHLGPFWSRRAAVKAVREAGLSAAPGWVHLEQLTDLFREWLAR